MIENITIDMLNEQIKEIDSINVESILESARGKSADLSSIAKAIITLYEHALKFITLNHIQRNNPKWIAAIINSCNLIIKSVGNSTSTVADAQYSLQENKAAYLKIALDRIHDKNKGRGIEEFAANFEKVDKIFPTVWEMLNPSNYKTFFERYAYSDEVYSYCLKQVKSHLGV